MELWQIATRAVVAYVVYLALLRASGKRTVAEGTPFDLIVALILGDLVDDLLWAEVSLARFVAAAGALTLVHTLVAWGAYVSPGFGALVGSTDTLLVKDGELVHAGLRAERLRESEVEALLRGEGIAHAQREEVAEARLEPDGRLALLRRPEAREASGRDRPRARRRRR